MSRKKPPAAGRQARPQPLLQPYALLAPERQRGPLVLASPHSGLIFPKDFLDQTHLDIMEIRRQLEDCHVDALFEFAPGEGIPLLKALISRAYVDLNREPYELDPAMYAEPIPVPHNSNSPRVRHGFGTIIKTLNDGAAIYDRKLPVSAALARIEAVHAPYHAALRQLIGETHRQFGTCLLLDCHSMPSTDVQGQQDRPDFVIGDDYGHSAPEELTEFVLTFFKKAGFSVAANFPFAGGYTTQHYGNVAGNQHVIQLEINRQLYMDARTLLPTEHFFPLQSVLRDFIRALSDFADRPALR